jgi:hypothetical protein
VVWEISTVLSEERIVVIFRVKDGTFLQKAGKTVPASKKPVNFYQTTRRHIPEYGNLNSYRRGKLKSTP